MTDVSTLGRSLNQIRLLTEQQSSLATLTNQLATGRKTDSFAELGRDGIISQRARVNISSIETYLGNISNVNRRIEQIDLSIAQFQEQTDNLINSLTIAPAEGDYPDFEIIQDLANNVYDFLLDLINTQDGDRFLFAGADSDTRPINDTGLFSSFLGDFVPDESNLTNPPLTASGAIGQWGAGLITTDDFISAYRGVDDTTLGYSAPLASDQAGNVFARIDVNSQIDYTVLGNAEGFTDILTAVGVLRELPPPEFAPGALNDPTALTFADDTQPFPPQEKQDNFFAVINDLQRLLADGVDKLESERFQLAQVQVQLNQTREGYEFERATLNNTIDDIENVDITQVATQINSLQIQLEASYAVTASVSQLTLVNFIS